MNFANLRYFVTVAEEMSISKAAARLYLSPQAVSSHIQRLEEECETPLFERNTRQLRLTYAGERVLEHAKRILDNEEEMRTELSDIANLRSGHLSLGTSQIRGRVILPDLLTAYMRQYPTVKITTHNGITEELESMLVNGTLDLQIGFLPFQSKLIQSVILGQERLCLIISHKLMQEYFPNPKAAAALIKKNGLDLNAFRNVPFILQKKGRILNMVSKYFEEIKFQPRVILEHSDLETLLILACDGLGATFSFESNAQKIGGVKQFVESGEVFVFPFQGDDAIAELAISYNKERYLSKTAQDFITLAKERYGKA